LIVFLKLFLVGLLSLVCYEDFKYQAVTAWYFLVIASIGGYLFLDTTPVVVVYLCQIFVNVALVGMVLMVLYTYSWYKIKRPFFSEVFGIGDVLFFIFLAVSFPVISFLVIFSLATFFSLILSKVLPRLRKQKTVPLAGLMAVFVLVVYLGAWALLPAKFLYAFYDAYLYR